jgi:hypothetical protein
VAIIDRVVEAEHRQNEQEKHAARLQDRIQNLEEHMAAVFRELGCEYPMPQEQPEDPSIGPDTDPPLRPRSRGRTDDSEADDQPHHARHPHDDRPGLR